MLASLLRALAACVAALPFRLLAAPGRLVRWVAFEVVRVRRRHVVEAMTRAGITMPEVRARATYRALGRGALELFWVAGARARRADMLSRCVAFDAALIEALDAALAAGPVVLAVSHTGNWELAGAGAARLLLARGRRLAVVAKRQSVRGIDAFWSEARQRLGVATHAPRGALTSAAAALRRGDVVAMPIDQVPDRARHALTVPFLGALAFADRAPAVLAARARATMLVVGARREGEATRVSLLERIPPTKEPLAFVDAATRAATAALERFVRDDPTCWLWLHRRWRAPFAAAPEPRALVASPHPG